MKAFLIVFSLVASAICSSAQGTVTFANNASSLVINQPQGNIPQPVGQGVLLALYAGPQGTQEGSLVLVSSINAQIGPVAGRFSTAESITVAGISPGGIATFQVRAWDGAYGSTWDAFLMSAPVDALRGVSALFDVDTANPNGMPPELDVSIAANFPGMVLVPEPSTYALGAMGLGALAFLRRRKA